MLSALEGWSARVFVGATSTSVGEGFTGGAAGFTTLDFGIDARRGIVTCPNGKTARAVDSGNATFAVEDCRRCKLKASCTTSVSRSVTLHPNEGMLIQLRTRKATRKGRAELRKRVTVEHRLARIGAIQGDTARYAGRAFA
jgi:hypothetical protein